MEVINIVEITTEADVVVQEHSTQSDTVPQPAAMEEVTTEGQLQIAETMEPMAAGGGSHSENEISLDLQKDKEETQRIQASLRKERRKTQTNVQRDD